MVWFQRFVGLNRFKSKTMAYQGRPTIRHPEEKNQAQCSYFIAAVVDEAAIED